MTIHKLNILFVISKSRKRKDGKAPLFCRLTFQEKRKQFATGLFVNPEHWDNRKQHVKPPGEESKFINSQLSLVKQKMNQAFLLLQVREGYYTVEDIYLQYKGENITAEKTLMEVFKLHNEKMVKLVGKEYSKATYYKFREAKKHVANFLQYQYRRRDIPLGKITLKFLDDFDY